ncbi:COG1811 Uncharacterized membrane protein, possible Na+ channel or pump [Candidatus Nanopelagicaceae bacterium]
MLVGSGTLLNVAAIAIGSGIGITLGNRMRESSQKLITDVLGLVTLLGATSALIPLWRESFNSQIPKSTGLLLILGSMLIGGVLGSALKLEQRLDTFGENLRKRFRASEESPFIEGFVSSSLLFVIGPLAILGSISDGAGQGIDQLILKSSLDFFAAMAFASTLGWGVMASIIPVGIYQGLWTIAGFSLGSVLDQYQIDAMTICGGLMLIAIALRLLDIKRISVGNLLPALFLAPLLATALHSFN